MHNVLRLTSAAVRRAPARLWCTLFAAAGLLLSPAAPRAQDEVSIPSPAAASEAGPGCTAHRPMLKVNDTLERTAERLATGAPLTILAIGSSTTAGVGASAPGAGYPLQFERLVEAALPGIEVRMHVSGVGGETAAQTLVRLEQQLAIVQPDLVLWQVGTNDALADVHEDAFRQLIEHGVASVLAIGADLVLIDQQFYPTISRPARYERFVSIVDDVGTRMKACVFSRYGLMKTWALHAPGGLRPMLAADGFHMSDRGYACLAGSLAREIMDAARTPQIATAAHAPQPLSPTPQILLTAGGTSGF